MAVYGKIKGEEIGYCKRFMHAASGSFERLESTHEQNVAFLDRSYEILIGATIAACAGIMLCCGYALSRKQDKTAPSQVEVREKESPLKEKAGG